MTEFLHEGQKIATLFITLGMCGVMFGLGLAAACKLLKWTPVNVTVNVTVKRD